MRSESDGHCLPTSFPGLAVRAATRAAIRGRSCRASATATTRRSASSSSTSRSCGRERLGRRGRAAAGGADPRGRRRLRARRAGTFRHVLVATGHPGLNVPEELAADPRTVHAYEPHDYADDVVVVGAGMAAATEWLNALAAGARVTSVRRREPRAAAAERAAAALLAPRPRRVPRDRARRARRPARRLLAPSYPPAASGTSRSSAPGRASASPPR